MQFNRNSLEYLRHQSKQRFQKVQDSFIECGRWALPHRVKWLLSQSPGQRTNQHIVDGTHLLALRTFVAGFLEGNTSAARPWYRLFSADEDSNNVPENKEWLQHFTDRTLRAFSVSNFYNSAGVAYADYGVFNTACHYFEEMGDKIHFHNPEPGAYFPLNNGRGEAVILVCEYSLTVKALVEEYGTKTKSGSWDWSNFSSSVKKLYQEANYTQMVNITRVILKNDEFDPRKPVAGENRQWVSWTYETGGQRGEFFQDSSAFGWGETSIADKERYLRVSYSKRKPFIVARSDSSQNFEYGEKGPTLDSLGIIKSLNKKEISKDRALDQMLTPTLQGPANLKKSYITSAPNSYIPLDATSVAKGSGLRQVFEINPAIGALFQDQQELRSMVNKFYYADYLMFLTQNPKTRTATEANAVVQEQQRIIGPNLQSLNTTYNVPLVEFIMDFVLDTDPYLKPPPEALAGKFLQADFISIFAQAQKSADLPAINQYVQSLAAVGQFAPQALDKLDVDKYADLLEDRLYIPEGLNRDQSKVDAMRQQAQAAAQKQQMMQETIPAMAGAAKDVGLKLQS